MGIADDLQGLAGRLVEPLRGYFLSWGSAYDSGTWTPSFIGSTTAGSFTYTATRYGVWHRVGQIVYVWCEVGISAITGAPAGNMRVNMPFVAGSGVNYSLAIGTISDLDYPAGMLELTTYVEGGQSYAVLAYSRDNAATLAYPASSFTNTNTIIRLSGAYLVPNS